MLANRKKSRRLTLVDRFCIPILLPTATLPIPVCLVCPTCPDRAGVIHPGQRLITDRSDRVTRIALPSKSSRQSCPNTDLTGRRSGAEDDVADQVDPEAVDILL